MNLKIFFIFISISIWLFIIIPIGESVDSRKQQNFSVYNFPGFTENGPKVVFISGVHGNENSGPLGLQKLIDGKYFNEFIKDKCGLIKVIPIINEWGFQNKKRLRKTLWNSDINRSFLDDSQKEIRDIFIQKILQSIEDVDFVIDFHEGWNFHTIQNQSLGSTISPGNTKQSQYLAKIIVNNLNRFIKDRQKKYIVLQRTCEIRNTLSCYIDKRTDKNYILVEITGQDNIQPLSIRLEHVNIIVTTILRELFK